MFTLTAHLLLLAGQPLAVRNCSVVEGPEYFRWQDPEHRDCGTARGGITIQDVQEVMTSIYHQIFLWDTSVPRVCQKHAWLETKPPSPTIASPRDIVWGRPLKSAWWKPGRSTPCRAGSIGPGQLQTYYRRLFIWSLKIPYKISQLAIGTVDQTTVWWWSTCGKLWKRGDIADSDSCPCYKVHNQVDVICGCNVIGPSCPLKGPWSSWPSDVPHQCKIGDHLGNINSPCVGNSSLILNVQASNCKKFVFCGQVEVSAGNVEEVAEFLANQTSEPAPDGAQQVDAISDILTNIVDAGVGDTQVGLVHFR